MVNPRWRPTIANSRETKKTKLKSSIKNTVALPPPGE